MPAYAKIAVASLAIISATPAHADASGAPRRLGLSSTISSIVSPFAAGIDALKSAAVDPLKNFAVAGVKLAFGDISLVVDASDEKYDDTVFTTENYLKPQLDFLLAGLKEDNGVSYINWFLEGTGATEIRSGLVRPSGPNTNMLIGYNDVKEALELMDARIESGDLERKNELGIQILNPSLWPEKPGGISTIGLGQSNKNHEFVRPLLAEALDKGSRSGNCDGSTCWNDAYLRSMARSFFEGKTEFDTSDAKWWTTQVLHKIHLNMDLDEAAARRFADYMSKMIILIPLPDQILENSVIDNVLSVTDTLDKKAGYLTAFKEAIRSKYSDRDFVKNNDLEKIELLASVYLDSLQFAGGLSVPTVLSYMLALTHMSEDNKHPSLKGVELSEDNLTWIMWETLRKYAPVAGVPFWTSEGAGNDWAHVIPNVAAALSDATVFEDPLVFKNRGLAKYHATMMKNGNVQNAGMGWAGPAIARNADGEFDTAAPNSHNCPAQDLSFRMMKAFIQEFIAAGPWRAVDANDISVSSYSASSFKALRRGLTHTTGCAYVPKCKEGYSWVKTSWCWWGRRNWTCEVV